MATHVLTNVRNTELNVAGQIVTYSVSIGVAHWPTSQSNQSSLYSAADVALYDAKRRGRNQFQTYNPETNYEDSLPTSTQPEGSKSRPPHQSSSASESTGPL